MDEFTGIALEHAKERFLGSQPALRQALGELAKRTAAEAPRMVRR